MIFLFTVMLVVLSAKTAFCYRLGHHARAAISALGVLFCLIGIFNNL